MAEDVRERPDMMSALDGRGIHVKADVGHPFSVMYREGRRVWHYYFESTPLA